MDFYTEEHKLVSILTFPLSLSLFFSSLLWSRSGISQRYSAGLRAGWSGVRIAARDGNFSLHHRVQTGSGPQLASYPMGSNGSLGVKRPGREAENSPPSSAEVKMRGATYLGTTLPLPLPLLQSIAKCLSSSMVHSTWEANSNSASQGIPHLLWNPKVRYRILKDPSLVALLSQIHPVHTHPPYSPKIQSNIVFPSTPRSSQWYFVYFLKLKLIMYRKSEVVPQLN
jgi:hypothetical protein